MIAVGSWSDERTREAILQERERGLGDAKIAELFRAMPRSFPPCPSDLGEWNGYSIRVAARRGKRPRHHRTPEEEFA